MDLKKILAISGKPGLYKIVSQTKNGIVVESLTDGKRFTAFAHERMSSLEEISIYTTGEDLPLKMVLKNIFEKENGQKSLDPNIPEAELITYFATVAPDYDTERVYKSDIRKVFKWYNLLAEKSILDFNEEEQLQTGASQDGSSPENQDETAESTETNAEENNNN